MRASTMLALTLALLSGLGAVVAARYAGWLGKIETPPPVVKEREVQVLVAARNLFPGDVIDPTWVKTRTLRADELADYDAHKNDYLPASVAAGALRVTKTTVEAESPLLRKHLQEMVKPDALNLRLLPNMRALNLSLMKDQSAGGLVQVGEWVDLYLTSTVKVGDQETTRTAVVASNLRVIAKRNALWQVFAPLPDDKTVNFTLEANPYRAGLIEYVKAKGTLSMVPVSASEQRYLEQRRNKALNEKDPKVLPVSFASKATPESDGEEHRVEAFTHGEYAIGTTDLVRLFDLQTPPPPRSNIVVEQFNGLSRSHVTKFDPDGNFLSTEEPKKSRPSVSPGARSSAQDANSFQFFAPNSNDKGCKSCKKDKK